jgi:hypothetical protein
LTRRCCKFQLKKAKLLVLEPKEPASRKSSLLVADGDVSPTGTKEGESLWDFLKNTDPNDVLRPCIPRQDPREVSISSDVAKEQKNGDVLESAERPTVKTDVLGSTVLQPRSSGDLKGEAVASTTVLNEMDQGSDDDGSLNSFGSAGISRRPKLTQSTRQQSLLELLNSEPPPGFNAMPSPSKEKRRTGVRFFQSRSRQQSSNDVESNPAIGSRGNVSPTRHIPIQIPSAPAGNLNSSSSPPPAVTSKGPSNLDLPKDVSRCISSASYALTRSAAIAADDDGKDDRDTKNLVQSTSATLSGATNLAPPTFQPSLARSQPVSNVVHTSTSADSARPISRVFSGMPHPTQQLQDGNEAGTPSFTHAESDQRLRANNVLKNSVVKNLNLKFNIISASMTCLRADLSEFLWRTLVCVSAALAKQSSNQTSSSSTYLLCTTRTGSSTRQKLYWTVLLLPPSSVSGLWLSWGCNPDQRIGSGQ